MDSKNLHGHPLENHFHGALKSPAGRTVTENFSYPAFGSSTEFRAGAGGVYFGRTAFHSLLNHLASQFVGRQTGSLSYRELAQGFHIGSVRHSLFDRGRQHAQGGFHNSHISIGLHQDRHFAPKAAPKQSVALPSGEKIGRAHV